MRSPPQLLASITDRFQPSLAVQTREQRASSQVTWCKVIGEVGLDAGPQFYKSLDLQIDVLRRVLRACATAGDKIVSLHSVRSARLVLDLIEAELPHDRGLAVMHWFTGSMSEMRRALSLGCYFSVNEQMANSDNGRRLLGELPIDRVLTETDGPFVQRRGRPLPPGDVEGVLDVLGALYGIGAGAVRAQILANLENIEKSD